MSAELDPSEVTAIRAGVERAVLSGQGGLREAIERDPVTFLHLLAAAQIGAQEAEMKLLDDEGRRGAHLVDFGPLYLVVEDSDERWTHRRLFGVTPARRNRLEADGWISVGSWFPFHYFKKPLGQAAA